MGEFILTCTVNQAGVAGNGSETPNPVIYINLTDSGGSFAATDFYAADPAKNEMLAVALAAISGQKKVTAIGVTPNPGNYPITPVVRLFLTTTSS
jgi:hypothetical protein